jgi:hypothetical protein
MGGHVPFYTVAWRCLPPRFSTITITITVIGKETTAR